MADINNPNIDRSSSMAQQRERSASTIARDRTRSVIRHMKSSTEKHKQQQQQQQQVEGGSGQQQQQQQSGKRSGKDLWTIARSHREDGSLSDAMRNNPVAWRTLWQLPNTTEWWRRVASAPHRRMPSSDEVLPLHPAVIEETLPNGMRVFLFPNVTPVRRVFMRLIVRVGSLNEAEGERGWAHLVEHIVFRTTKNFKSGQIDDFMRSIGADIGADANALTSFDYTEYDLLIPFSSGQECAERCRTAIKIMGDFAAGACFLDEDVKTEKSIVLEEWRRSRSEVNDARTESLLFELQDLPHAKRLVIGTEAGIEGATPEGLRAFYQKWYQPQLMSIVISGDMGSVDDVCALVRETFSPMQASTNPEIKPFDITPHVPAIPRSVTNSNEPRVRLYSLPDVATAEVRFSFLTYGAVTADKWNTKGAVYEDLLVTALSLILDNRLAGLKSSYATKGILDVSVNDDSSLSRAATRLSVVVDCAADKLGAAIECMWLYCRSLREVPVSSVELARALELLDLYLCDGFLEESHVSSNFCRDALSEYFRERDSFIPPAMEMQLWETMRMDITPSAVLTKARAVLDPAACYINVELPGSVKEPWSVEDIHKILRATDSKALPTADTFIPRLAANFKLPAPEDLVEKPEFPPETADGIVYATTHPEQKMMVFTLYNGMTVTVVEPTAKTDVALGHDEDPFPVKCTLKAMGDGQIETFLDEHFEQYLGASVACTIAASVGLAGLTADEMSLWSQSNMVSVRHLATDMFGRKIELAAGKGREELLLQFLFAFFSNRKPWDPEAVNNAVDQLKIMATHMHSSPVSKFEKRVSEVNTCRHPFFYPTLPAEYDTLDRKYAEDYFVECFQHPTDYKMVLIGDLGDFAQTRAKIAKYLAVLAPVPVLDRLPVPEPQPAQGDEDADANANANGNANSNANATTNAAATSATAQDPNEIDDRSRKNTMANKMRAPITPPEDAAPKPLSPNPPADKLPRVMRIGVRRNQLEYRVVSALKRFSWQVPFPQDIVDDVIYGGVDMRSEACITFPLPPAFDDLDFLYTNVLCVLLEKRLTDVLRNDMGGVYCVSVIPSYICAELPGKLLIRFTCSPVNVEQLVLAALECIGILQFNGATPEEVVGVLRCLAKEDEDRSRDNSYWAHKMATLPMSGLPTDPDQLAQLRESLVTKFSNPDTCRSLMALLLPLHHFTVVVMLPQWMERVPPHEVSGLTFFRKMREDLLDAHLRASVLTYGDFAEAMRASSQTGEPPSELEQMDAEIAALENRLVQLKKVRTEVSGATSSVATAGAAAAAAGAAGTALSALPPGSVSSANRVSASKPVPGAWFWKTGQLLGSATALTGRKKRYMDLDGNEIHYYVSVKNGVPHDEKGIIQITKSTTVSCRGKQLIIKAQKRTWNLEATEEKIAQTWAEAVQHVIDSQK